MNLYTEFFITYKYIYITKKLDWSFYQKVNSEFHDIEFKFYPRITDKYITNNISIIREDVIHYKSPLCDTFMLSFPCSKHTEQKLTIKSSKYNKEYVFKAGTILIFDTSNLNGMYSSTHGVVKFLATSENSDYIIFYQDNSYLLDVQSGGLVKISKELEIIAYVK